LKKSEGKQILRENNHKWGKVKAVELKNKQRHESYKLQKRKGMKWEEVAPLLGLGDAMLYFDELNSFTNCLNVLPYHRITV